MTKNKVPEPSDPAQSQRFKLSDYIFLPKWSTGKGKAYWIVIIIALSLPVILLLSTYITRESTEDHTISIWGENAHLFRIALLVLWALHWFRIFTEGSQKINENEVAALILFGKYHLPVPAGLVLTIPGAMWILRAPKGPKIYHFPGTDRQIFNGDINLRKTVPADEQTLPDGMVRPMRIECATPEVAAKFFPKLAKLCEGKPLHRQMTVTMKAYGLINIRQDIFEKFVTYALQNGYTDGEDVINFIHERLSPIVKRAIDDAASKRTLAMIYADRDAFDAEVFQNTEDGLERPNPKEPALQFGMNLAEFKVQDIDATKEVNTALRDQVVTAIKLDTAELAKKTKAKESEANAYAVQVLKEAEAIGEGKIIEEVAKAIGNNDHGALVAQWNIFKGALKEANYSFIPENNIFASFGGIKLLEDAMEKVKNKKKGGKNNDN